MFRDQRRKGQSLSIAETEVVLKRGQSGVLGVSGDDGYPYAVPLSYAYENGKLYFHCANKGHKLDGIRRNDKVSFCVIDQDQIVAEKFTTYFRSVIVFGRARIIGSDDATHRHALELLVRKYSPGYEKEGEAIISREGKAACVVEITIEHMSGKQAKELAGG